MICPVTNPDNNFASCLLRKRETERERERKREREREREREGERVRGGMGGGGQGERRGGGGGEKYLHQATVKGNYFRMHMRQVQSSPANAPRSSQAHQG